MQTSLDAYLLKLDKWLDSDLCGQAITALESARWRKHSYTRPGEVGSFSLSDEQELDVAFAGEFPFDAAIARKMAMAVEYYAVRLQFPWFSPTRNSTEVRYNSYSKGQLMTEHCDHIQLVDGRDDLVPTLSCLTVLNDDFEGGEFVMWGDKVIETRAGTTLVFPSNFLFPHRVEPVRSNRRYSCVTWSW